MNNNSNSNNTKISDECLECDCKTDLTKCSRCIAYYCKDCSFISIYNNEKNKYELFCNFCFFLTGIEFIQKKRTECKLCSVYFYNENIRICDCCQEKICQFCSENVSDNIVDILMCKKCLKDNDPFENEEENNKNIINSSFVPSLTDTSTISTVV